MNQVEDKNNIKIMKKHIKSFMDREKNLVIKVKEIKQSLCIK